VVLPDPTPSPTPTSTAPPAPAPVAQLVELSATDRDLIGGGFALLLLLGTAATVRTLTK
jgi:hypothetical protein